MKIEQILYPYKNALWALRPAKPLGVLSRHPCRNPKPLPRGEGLCMLCWLCIVQSLWAYTPGIRAGAECGAAALTPLGATPQTPFSKIYRFFDSLQLRSVTRAEFSYISVLGFPIIYYRVYKNQPRS